MFHVGKNRAGSSGTFDQINSIFGSDKWMEILKICLRSCMIADIFKGWTVDAVLVRIIVNWLSGWDTPWIWGRHTAGK